MARNARPMIPTNVLHIGAGALAGALATFLVMRSMKPAPAPAAAPGLQLPNIPPLPNFPPVTPSGQSY